MRPCLPPDVLAAAAAAEQRRDTAIDQLLRELGRLPKDDEFEARMVELIDADARVINLLDKRKGP